MWCFVPVLCECVCGYVRKKALLHSVVLIFGWILSCDGSGVTKVTDAFGVDINDELT